MTQQNQARPPQGQTPAWLGNWKVWAAIAIFVGYVLAGWHLSQLIGRAAVLAMIGAIVYILGNNVSFQLSPPALDRLAGWGLALIVGGLSIWGASEAKIFDIAGNAAASIVWAPGAMIIDGLKWIICIAMVAGIIGFVGYMVYRHR